MGEGVGNGSSGLEAELLALTLETSAGLAGIKRALDDIAPKIDRLVAERHELREALSELYEYVKKIEGPYTAQAVVRGHMRKPEELHPGVGELGERVRRLLGIEEPES